MAELDNGRVRATLGTSFDAFGTPIISLVGELDISNVAAIEAQVDSIVSSDQNVSFDLSALTFMDSSGIAMLLRVAERAGSVALWRPSATVKRIIRVTGLTDVFEIVDQ
jgi:anti-sigma B factor antagonist